MQGIEMLVRQIAERRSEVEIQYTRVVRPGGNPAALRAMKETFEVGDARWRGIGVIPKSGLRLRRSYARFDAVSRFALKPGSAKEPAGCRCGDILRAVKTPEDCRLFGKRCTPENPVGPCMVSTEGTCAAHYKYARLPKFTRK
jgi:hydrogenase expression/formation protein HypD